MMHSSWKHNCCKTMNNLFTSINSNFIWIAVFTLSAAEGILNTTILTSAFVIKQYFLVFEIENNRKKKKEQHDQN